MNFDEQMKSFSQRIKDVKENVQTEEATKTSLIMPFFQALGYDVFNPSEFMPEFTADVGIKKGEKVDYAIIKNGNPIILIECKSINDVLTKHDSQLFRYFGTSQAKFAILTNGAIYRFFTDLDEVNKMDEKPFLEINMLNLKENHILELRKFHKNNLDLESIKDTASDLKYLGLIRSVLVDLFSREPDDDFVRFILRSIYDGVKTQNVVDRYKPLIKKSIAGYINDLVNDKIQSALNSQKEEYAIIDETPEIEPPDRQIVTTDEELESFYVVKSILSETLDPSRIFYKDTLSYFGILLDNKTTKWICRIYLKETTKYIKIVDANSEEQKFDLSSIDDIYKHKKALLSRTTFLLKEK